MKKLIVLTVAVILSTTVTSRSKTSTINNKQAMFSSASFSPKTFLATAD